jgi:hypothetical protein
MRQSISTRPIFRLFAAGLLGGSFVFGGCSVKTTENNKPPSVIANTPAAEVKVGAVVQLDASKTTDPEKDSLTFLWALKAPTGSKAVIAKPADPKTSFTADVKGTYEIKLDVTDAKKNTVKKTLSVKAVDGGKTGTKSLEGAPISLGWTFVEAKASAERVPTGGAVTLWSTGKDMDENVLINWTLTSKPVGSAATLSDPEAASPTIVLDAPGRYELLLEASDGVTTTTSTVSVEALGTH